MDIDLKIENVEVFGFRAAINSLRHGVGRFYLGDSMFRYGERTVYSDAIVNLINFPEAVLIGPRDFELIKERPEVLEHIKFWADMKLSEHTFSELSLLGFDVEIVGDVWYTVSMSYGTALTIYLECRDFRSSDWNENSKGSICSFIKSLPYMREFIEMFKE